MTAINTEEYGKILEKLYRVTPKIPQMNSLIKFKILYALQQYLRQIITLTPWFPFDVKADQD